MKNTFEKLISSMSLTFLIFPYLVYVLLNSDLGIELFFLSVLLLGFDYFISRHLKNYFIRVVITVSVLIFFYCKLIFNDTEITIHQLRFREFIILFSTVTLIVSLLLLKITEGQKMINVFLLIFGCTFFLNTNANKYFNQEYILKENEFVFDNELSNTFASNSPVIFLLFDELSSTNEIFSYTKDSVDISFDEQLKRDGFEVITDFSSLSTRTKFSMPSIFNFNLHKNSRVLDSLEKINENVTIQKSYYWIASNNLLVDSLNNKGVKSISYGLFPFKKGTVKQDFIYWWPSFLDPLRMFGGSQFLTQFFQNSFLKSIESVLIEVTTVDEFRESVFEELKNLTPEKNNFYYFHFFAPHEPFTWGEEYQTENSLMKGERDPETELSEHIKYRRFFLNKVLPLVKSEKFKNSKIIIVGDHGFRFNREKINPTLTNIYLFNYPKGVLTRSEHVVQDLGYLILNSFN